MIRSTIRSVKAVVLTFSFLLVSALALGQGGAATGDLHVSVKDPRGNFITNASVKARDVAKGLERTATGDGQGGYSAQLLPPGTYAVTIDAAGFSGVLSTGVVITVGGTVELPVVLSVAGGKEVIEVNSQADLVETSRSSTTNTIGQRRIDNLPINGRNYIDFTLTDSQVVRDNAPNTGAAPTSGLNISGQRARSNLVNVDGADNTDNSVNGVRSTVSQEAVQEFQVITNSYAAEYGRAAGGVVNIITRSGSNAFHGDVFGYLRDRDFQAVNPFSTVPNPAYTRVQAGVAFGGPIKKDKTYYYFAYEVTRRPRNRILQHRARQFWAHSIRRLGVFRRPCRDCQSSTDAPADCVPGQPGRRCNSRRQSGIRWGSGNISWSGRRVFRNGGEWCVADRVGARPDRRTAFEFRRVPDKLCPAGAVRARSRFLPDAGVAGRELPGL